MSAPIPNMPVYRDAEAGATVRENNGSKTVEVENTGVHPATQRATARRVARAHYGPKADVTWRAPYVHRRGLDLIRGQRYGVVIVG